MKKIFSILGALLIISSLVLAGGKENPSPSSLIVMYGDVVKVFYNSDKASKVKVTIYGKNGKEVFSETFNSRSGFVRPYNLSSLPKGEFKVVLEDGRGTTEKMVSNLREDAKVSGSIINVKQDQGKCMVILYSKNETDVTVRFLDENQNVLSTESYTVNGQASKLFNFRRLKGLASVEVSDKNGVIKSTALQSVAYSKK